MLCKAQENAIHIEAKLNIDDNALFIKQEITFVNTSDSILSNIYLHNWANSFRDRKTPLSKRLIKDFRKDLYFAKEENLGKTTIKNLAINFANTEFDELEDNADILQVFLKQPLVQKDSLKISLTYTVKIPSAKFTGYGKTKEGFHLRYWYITPAVYDESWHLMSNLNIDDLYEKATNFTIELDIPKEYILESNLYQYKTDNTDFDRYFLSGKNKTDIILGVNKSKVLRTFKTENITVSTDVFNEEVRDSIATDILSRELHFIETFLGKYPHKELYIDKVTQSKDPIYGLSQLPDFLRPFSDIFKWDVTMFKAVSRKYIENTLLLNKRQDHWFLEGLQNYLMIEYIEEFYPNTKLLGDVSNYWFIKSFNFSKLDFNDKYPFVYQFISRQFLDQSLDTSTDSLSNFNRKIANKYKAGLGFRYLKGFLGDSILNHSIRDFYQKNQNKIVSSLDFQEILSAKTTKNIDWFFNDFIKTNKKIDHTIDKVVIKKDSLEVTIKNKRNITTPVLLYGLKDKEIKFKKWITNVEDLKTTTIPKHGINKVALNYENLYPEINTLDNWRDLQDKIFNKPLKFSLIKDIEDPYYNQIFYQPNVSYNFYNGLILGARLHNKPLIARNLELSFAPSYATKSNTVIGSFSALYNQYFEKTSIYKIMYGVSGQTLDYAPNLSYRSFVPFVNIIFKRKDLRDATQEFVRARLLHIDKEIPEGQIKTSEDNYSVFSASYNFINPDIIKEFRYNFSFEYAEKFSKIATDLRFRSLSTSDTQLDFRVFAGVFLHNNSVGDYFSFGLDRANDYLFQLNYFGRSEDSGIFSQQYIIAEGGFKSALPVRFANQFMLSFNSSIGIWRWVEFYNDVAFLKSRENPVYFGYNNGVRLNFIHNILEIYFPLYSNNGWEITQESYPQKIRFTLTGDISSIYNFFRRGFL
ncbi:MULTISPECIES: M1 family metallopeptidase [unclassified Polaribacter]|uniref:M1 family metallopeptidase n=1 Tax=unclassified Polaribacter TaxID=196858 RepID=UPI0011BD97FC|nr:MULTISPECIES: M1 family metallopeptidase [unclassified Polaribacter]TXD53685.1 M1 family metallopeptidase [Polaribacter sp. IC063]TXD62088.1 M1 family metallopeptidase [Polaribacter sp. IC066]